MQHSHLRLEIRVHFLYHRPHLVDAVPPRLGTAETDPGIFLLLVVRADPRSGQKVLRDLEPTGKAGADVAAQPPGVLHAVEGVQERGQRQSRFSDEVGDGVGFDVSVGNAVGRVD